VIRFGSRRIAVAEILDRWLAPDHRYFKVKGDDDAVYVLRHDPAADEWELTVLDRTDRPAGPIVDPDHSGST